MARPITLFHNVSIALLSIVFFQNIAMAEPSFDEPGFSESEFAAFNFGETDTNDFESSEPNIDDFGLSEADLNKSILNTSGSAISASEPACTEKGTLDYIEMRMTMAAHQDDIYEAYRLFSQSNPGYGGELKLEITVLPSGQVKSVEIETGIALPFSQAITKKVSAIEFPGCSQSSQFKHTMYFGPEFKTLVDPTLNTCLLPREIEKTIQARAEEIISNYKTELKKTPELKGTIEYRFNILPAGKTESISIESREELAFANQIKKILLSLRFPSCDQATVVNVPIKFIPSPQNNIF
ncbi:AgmX/PglI C-terminal domain-containing protein [Pseudomonadota bacterium]